MMEMQLEDQTPVGVGQFLAGAAIARFVPPLTLRLLARPADGS